MENAVFGKTMENVRKHSDIKLVTTETRKNYLVSEPNYHIKFISNKSEKTEIPMNKPVHLGLPIL